MVVLIDRIKSLAPPKRAILSFSSGVTGFHSRGSSGCGAPSDSIPVRQMSEKALSTARCMDVAPADPGGAVFTVAGMGELFCNSLLQVKTATFGKISHPFRRAKARTERFAGLSNSLIAIRTA